MDWQQMAALGIVGATASVFALRSVRRRRHALSSAKSCGGCSAGRAEPPAASIVFKAQKGRPRQIVIKAS